MKGGLASSVLSEQQEFVPATGANVVGVDGHAKPGEALYLIRHFESVEDAKRFAETVKVSEGDAVYVYPAGMLI